MKTNKIGLIIFLIGAIYMIGMAFIIGWGWVGPALSELSLDQYNKTVWEFGSALFLLWAFSVPLGSILASVGILIYVRAKPAHIWLFGIGLFLVLIIIERLLPTGHFTPLFGVGGGMILTLFLAILWFWGKRRTNLKGPNKLAADFQLTGYIFFLITAWFLCKDLGTPYMKALESFPIESPISIMVYLVLGWLFLFLSHFIKAKNS